MQAIMISSVRVQCRCSFGKHRIGCSKDCTIVFKQAVDNLSVMVSPMAEKTLIASLVLKEVHTSGLSKTAHQCTSLFVCWSTDFEVGVVTNLLSGLNLSLLVHTSSVLAMLCMGTAIRR